MQYVNGLNFDIGYSRMYSSCMTIGHRLDEAMRNAKITSQSSLARTSGVPQATISRILKNNGKKGPETETIKKLAAACNVSFDWLNEGIGDTSRRAQKLAVVNTRSPETDDSVLADVVELIAAFKDASKQDRKLILKSAKLAAKRASVDVLNSTRD